MQSNEEKREELLKESRTRDLNRRNISYLNRADRRKAYKLMNTNITPEQMSDEIKRISRGHSSGGGALIKMWKSIINNMRKPDPYYFHIPKQVRPIMAYPNGIKQTDFVKCEKIRKRRKW